MGNWGGLTLVLTRGQQQVHLSSEGAPHPCSLHPPAPSGRHASKPAGSSWQVTAQQADEGLQKIL